MANTTLFLAQPAAYGEFSDDSISFAYPLDQVQGNTNIVLISWANTTGIITSFADDNGNLYTQIFFYQGNGHTVVGYVATGIIPGPNSVNLDAVASLPGCVIYLLEINGIASPVTDQTPAVAGGFSRTPTSGNITTAHAADILVGIVVPTKGATAGTPGWNTIITATNQYVLEYNIVNATGTYAASATMGGSGNGNWAAAIAALQAAKAAVLGASSAPTLSSLSSSLFSATPKTLGASSAPTTTSLRASATLLNTKNLGASSAPTTTSLQASAQAVDRSAAPALPRILQSGFIYDVGPVTGDTVTLSQIVPAGQTVLIALTYNTGTGPTINVTDNAGSSYHSKRQQRDGNNFAQWYVCDSIKALPAGITQLQITVDMGQNVNNLMIVPMQFEGTDLATIYDPPSVTGANFTNTTTAPTLNVTVGIPNESVLAVVYSHTVAPTPVAGWGTVALNANGGGVFILPQAPVGTYPANPCTYPTAPQIAMCALAIVPPIPVTLVSDNNGKYLPQGLLTLLPTDDTLGHLINSPAWTTPYCTGVTVRINWGTFEPSPEAYAWNYLDTALALAAQHGKIIGLIFSCGYNAPDWVKNSGISLFYQHGTAGGPPGQGGPAVPPGYIPAPWDPAYQQILGGTIVAIANRYDNNPRFTYMVCGGYGWGVGMGFCRSQADNDALAATTFNGLTGTALYEKGYKDVTQIYLTAFKKTRLLCTYFPYLWPGSNLSYQKASANLIQNWLIPTAGPQAGLKYNNATGGSGGQNATPYGLIKVNSPNHPTGLQPQYASPDNWPKTLAAVLATTAHFCEAYNGQVLSDQGVGGINYQATLAMIQWVAKHWKVFSPYYPPAFNPVAPYAGQSQTGQIAMAYPPADMECGPRPVPPWPGEEPESDEAFVPPPVYLTDIFSAQQTWPL